MTLPLCGCQPCRRAGRGTVQRNTHPPGYYRSVLGCPDARAVALESPFPPEHLGLYCLPGISTRYRDREASVQAVSDALAALARAKVGNYLAFFPSYAYLRQVHEDFTARYPDIGTLAQESVWTTRPGGLSGTVRPSPAKTLLGFGVMGGIFGEGVDLVGDRLIGCAIVGGRPAPGEPPAGDPAPLL